jgi:hypothetical protein
MKRPAWLLFAACFAAMIGTKVVVDARAAEVEAPTQVLAQLDSPDLVMAAHWTRLSDAYVLKVVIDKPAKAAADPEPARPAQDPGTPAERAARLTQGPEGRSTFFIGNTIAKLRGMDPTFGCRVLTLVDGRRPLGGQPPAPARPSPTMHQSYPPEYKDPRVEVWLLKADGTQMLPATYSCDWSRPEPAKAVPHAEISYEFPLAGMDQAVAAAIRVEDKYFVQKLPTSSPPR